MGRKRKNFGWDVDRRAQRNKLRFLPAWLTGAGGYRGGNWAKTAKKAITSAKGRSRVDGSSDEDLEVNHLAPFWLFQGEQKPGSRANRLSNLMPMTPGDHKKLEVARRVRPEDETEEVED